MASRKIGINRGKGEANDATPDSPKWVADPTRHPLTIHAWAAARTMYQATETRINAGGITCKK